MLMLIVVCLEANLAASATRICSQKCQWAQTVLYIHIKFLCKTIWKMVHMAKCPTEVKSVLLELLWQFGFLTQRHATAIQTSCLKYKLWSVYMKSPQFQYNCYIYNCFCAQSLYLTQEEQILSSSGLDIVPLPEQCISLFIPKEYY